MARKWFDSLVMDREIEREIEHIWERVREHSVTISGVSVLQMQVQTLIQKVDDMGKNRKWMIAQVIASLSVVASIVGAYLTR